MLLLLSIYKGVSDGSVEYIRKSKADLWVLQRHSYNILRGNSYLSLNFKKVIEKVAGIKSVSPVFFQLASIQLPNSKPSLFIAGYNPESGMGGPPEIIKGQKLSDDNQIILDQSFASKYKIRIGDNLTLKNDTLNVVGISGGTNMFVIQYAFITLEKAFSIAGIRNYVSCFQVEVYPGSNVAAIASEIKAKLGSTSVFDRGTFLANNIAEMESGILTILYVIAFLSAVVLTALLSLILTINVLDRRDDFAVMKALGAPVRFIPGLVVKQSLILATVGLIFGILLFFPFAEIIMIISPEVSTRSSIFQLLSVTFAVEILSIISSLLPNYRLRSIYPLEVFK